MNYLAHAYLSFNKAEILIGNMISDFVKGKKKFLYSPGIQKGITLHRSIDQFTDEHPTTKAAKQFFKPTYGLYAGAFIDVVYDHFLATDTNEFPLNTDLLRFSKTVYQTLEDNFSVLPQALQEIFPFMKMQNWLCNYQHRRSIEKGFSGLVSRATYLNEYSFAFSIFNNHYEEFKNYYKEFFPELKQHASIQLSNLLAV